MAENENVLGNDNVPVTKQPKKQSGGIKEWFRKKVVALKRAPHLIALVVMLAATLFFMFVLFPLSNAINTCNKSVASSGICQFVVTLLSLLVLVSYLNAFPKRKKPNIFFIVLVFLMIGAMIACDAVIISETDAYVADQLARLAEAAEDAKKNLLDSIAAIEPVRPFLITHIVLLAVSAGVFALLPVYKRLINMINTKVELESATENMKGGIDIQED